MKKFFKTLTSSHYKMERFGVMFIALVLCTSVLMGSILRHKSVVDAQTLSDTVSYTSNVSFSLSGNTADVVGVYLDSQQTEAFVLLKFEDVTNLVTDASEYHMYVTGSDINGKLCDLSSQPMGSIYMFGSSGYMGLYLTDAAGFPEQVINIIVRCNSVIQTQENVSAYDDPSFNAHDQCSLFINPGASGFTPAAFLDEDRMGLYDIYEGTVVAQQEQDVRDLLDSDLEKMEMYLAQIDQYTSRIESVLIDGASVIVPDAPNIIYVDKVLLDKDGNRYLSTSTHFMGAYVYDWRGGSIREGYLDDLVPEGSTVSKWMATQSSLAQVNDTKDTFSRSIDSLTWYWTDGSVYTGENALGTSRLSQVANDIVSLKAAWANYYDAKYAYEVIHAQQLLLLELDAEDVVLTYTVNSEDAVTLW